MVFKAKNKILYKDWLWDWLSYKGDYVKESTYANYSNIISNHIIPDLGNYYLNELTNKIIQDFLLSKYKNGRMDNSGGLSNKTIKDIMAIIKSSLKKAMKEDLIQNISLDFVYPSSTSSNTSQKNKVYTLSKQDQDKLEDYILKHPSIKSLGILLALYSGIRIGELCALQWKDIDFKNNILHISKTLQRVYIKDSSVKASKIVISNPKTNNAKRDIPINKDFAEILKKYETDSEDYILTCSNKWAEPRTYRLYYEKILEKANIEKINFHGLRHTFATNCISLGIDYKTVSELLGHATINITLNLYAHPQILEKENCINLICEKFAKKCH